MNIHVPVFVAEHTPHKLTHEDVALLVANERLPHDKKFELIDGVLYQMPSEGTPHVLHKAQVSRFLARLLSDEWMIIPDSALLLSDLDAPEPDIYVYPAFIRHDDLVGTDIRLVIEIAVSSLRFDSGLKARTYARHGVQEYWIVDVEGRQTKVLRKPLADGDWGEAAIIPFDQPLRAAHTEGLELTIASLPNLTG